MGWGACVGARAPESAVQSPAPEAQGPGSDDQGSGTQGRGGAQGYPGQAVEEEHKGPQPGERCAAFWRLGSEGVDLYEMSQVRATVAGVLKTRLGNRLERSTLAPMSELRRSGAEERIRGQLSQVSSAGSGTMCPGGGFRVPALGRSSVIGDRGHVRTVGGERMQPGRTHAYIISSVGSVLLRPVGRVGFRIFQMSSAGGCHGVEDQHD